MVRAGEAGGYGAGGNAPGAGSGGWSEREDPLGGGGAGRRGGPF